MTWFTICALRITGGMAAVCQRKNSSIFLLRRSTRIRRVGELAQDRRHQHQQVELQRRQRLLHAPVQPVVAFGTVGGQQCLAVGGEFDELAAPVGGIGAARDQLSRLQFVERVGQRLDPHVHAGAELGGGWD